MRELMIEESARFGTMHGHEVVLHFGDWQAEYEQLRRGAAVAWRPADMRLELGGRDRAAFLHRLCTNQVDRIPPGEVREAFLTDAKAHLVAHLFVAATADALLLLGEAGQSQTVQSHLDFYLVQDDVQLLDRGEAWTTLLLAGPQAAEVLAKASQSQTLSGHVFPLPHGTGQLWIGPRTEANRVWRAVRQAGARPCGRQALETRRIEQGWPVWGVDIGPANLAQEVGRDAQAISFQKGCYLGQETIARIESRGHVNRLLAGVEFSSPVPPGTGTPLSHDGQPVGQVTSAAARPQGRAPIGLAFLRRALAEPGSRLEYPDGTATVAPLPMD